MCWEPTTATSSPFSEATPPPHALTASARASTTAPTIPNRRGLIRKRAPGERTRSRCLTRLEHSIDQPHRSVEAVVTERHLLLGARVHGRVDAAPQLAELAGAEDEPADRRPAAAEDEVVRAEAR